MKHQAPNHDFWDAAMEKFENLRNAQIEARNEAIKTCPYSQGDTIKVSSAFIVTNAMVITVTAPFGVTDTNRWEVKALYWKGTKRESIVFTEQDIANEALTVELCFL